MNEKTYGHGGEKRASSYLTDEEYKEMYEESLLFPEKFWGKMGDSIDWIRPYKKVKNTSFLHDKVDIRWYEDGSLNVSVNCIDRHLVKKSERLL